MDIYNYRAFVTKNERLRLPCKIRYDSPDLTLLRSLKYSVRNSILAVTIAL